MPQQARWRGTVSISDTLAGERRPLCCQRVSGCSNKLWRQCWQVPALPPRLLVKRSRSSPVIRGAVTPSPVWPHITLHHLDPTWSARDQRTVYCRWQLLALAFPPHMGVKASNFNAVRRDNKDCDRMKNNHLRVCLFTCTFVYLHSSARLFVTGSACPEWYVCINRWMRSCVFFFGLFPQSVSKVWSKMCSQPPVTSPGATLSMTFY